MPAGPFIIPDKTILNIVGPTNLLNVAKSFSLSLHTSAMTADPTAMEVYADVSASEIAEGNGYTAGGAVMANDALTISGSTVKFTADPVEWTASGSGIPAHRYYVLRATGTHNGKVDPIVGYCLGDATPADIPLTTAGNKLTFTPNAAGIITITKA